MLSIACCQSDDMRHDSERSRRAGIGSRGTGLTLQVAHPAAGAVQGNGLVDCSTKGDMIELTNRALEVLSSDLKGYGVNVLCRRDCCVAELRTREACESGEWRMLLRNRRMTSDWLGLGLGL